MKDYNTNLKNKQDSIGVKEKTSAELVQVWLITTNNEVYISNNRPPAGRKLEIKVPNLTIQTKTISEAIKLIEVNWGILSPKDKLEQIYEFTEDNILTKGFILRLNMNLKNYKLIKEKDFGEFIDYVYLEDVVKGYSQEDSFKESYLGFLGYMNANRF